MRLLTLILLIGSNAAFKFDDCEQKPEALNQVRRVGPKAYAYNLDFFYQKALPYNAIHSFTDVFLQINLTNSDQYQIYQGSNCSSVQQLYDNDNRYFGLLRKAALLRSHHLNPFNDTIIGVSTAEPYEISVVIWEVSYIRVGIYLGAVVLFLLASKLVRNVLFYYTSGCSLGIIASILLVAFIVWRVAPKKTIGVPILIGGWSVSLYMLHFAWTNFQSIMLEYQKYVIGYFAAVLLISMAVCYKRGPPTDARSHDIAQWTLQLIALVLIHFSVQMIEVSFGTIFVLILLQIGRGFLFSGIGRYFSGLRTFWRKYFPKKRRLLNEEEYDDIGRRNTREQFERSSRFKVLSMPFVPLEILMEQMDMFELLAFLSMPRRPQTGLAFYLVRCRLQLQNNSIIVWRGRRIIWQAKVFGTRDSPFKDHTFYLGSQTFKGWRFFNKGEEQIFLDITQYHTFLDLFCTLFQSYGVRVDDENEILLQDQQMKRIEDEQKAAPLVGDKSPCSTLKGYYDKVTSPAFFAKANELAETYSDIRYIRGDGNCFYRAVLVGLVEIMLNDREKLLKFIASSKEWTDRLVNLGYLGDEYNEICAYFIEFLQKIADGKTKNEAVFENMNDDNTANYLLMFFRLITSGYLKGNSTEYEDQIPYSWDVHYFCESEIEAMWKEADHLAIIALVKATNIHLRIEYMDRSVAPNGGWHLNLPDDDDATFVPDITLLHRPGHYDLIYKQSVETSHPGLCRNSKLSPCDVSQMSGVSISMVDRAEISRNEFVDELEWLHRETTLRCFLDAEMWTNEILAYMPDKWCSPTTLPLYNSHSNPPMYESSPSSIASPPPSASGTEGEILPRSKRDYISKFAISLIKNKDFRRAAHFLEKTMKKNKLDLFLHYRALYLAYYQEHLENDSESVERKTSYAEGSSPFALLYQRMVDEKLRVNEDVWFEYLMGLLEIQLGLKADAEKSMRNVIHREPRIWPAWEALSLLITDIEDADNFSSNSGIKSIWMSDWFMVLVLQRFHQDSMAIQKCEQLVTRGMTGIPMIITKIASCSNARHDHDQAISNFEDIRRIDPYRLTDLHLMSDSLYIRSDQKALAELELEVYKTHKFRWETCCIVANYHALRRDSELLSKIFKRPLPLNPGLAALWVLIGHEFMEMKNNAAACVCYRRSTEINPADYRGWYGLGQMYDIMKMPAYSLFYYQEAQKCKPHDSRLLVALGDVYSKLNKIEDAEKCFTGAYLFGDVEGNALWNLAKLHEKFTDEQKAAQVYEVFLAVYENVASAEEKIIYAVAFLANYFFKVKNFDKAADFATKCMAHEALCQEGNRLFREISKIHAREGEQPSTSQDHGEGTSQGPMEQSPQEVGEEMMSEGEDEIPF